MRIKKRRNALALAPYLAPAGFNPFSPKGRISFLNFMKILPVINLRWHTFIMPFTIVRERGHADPRSDCLYISYKEQYTLNRQSWWAYQDSNLGPTGYEPVALAN